MEYIKRKYLVTYEMPLMEKKERASKYINHSCSLFPEGTVCPVGHVGSGLIFENNILKSISVLLFYTLFFSLVSATKSTYDTDKSKVLLSL